LEKLCHHHLTRQNSIDRRFPRVFFQFSRAEASPCGWAVSRASLRQLLRASRNYYLLRFLLLQIEIILGFADASNSYIGAFDNFSKENPDAHIT
jgi:hypothetical protein